MILKHFKKQSEDEGIDTLIETGIECNSATQKKTDRLGEKISKCEKQDRLGEHTQRGVFGAKDGYSWRLVHRK
jgi:hypothetical protein